MFPALLYAAGMGTRMGMLTATKPKPMIEVAGKPLIDHAFDILESSGVPKIVVNTHYRSSMIMDYLQTKDVVFSKEDKLLETGGGLKNAIPLLNGNPVITLNSDAVWSGPNPLHFLAGNWHDDMGALLLLVRRDQAVGHKGTGDFTIHESGHLNRGNDTIYTGLQIIRTDEFSACPVDVFSTNRIWDIMLKQRKIFGLEYTGKWCDVGNPESISLAENMLSEASPFD